MADYFLLDVLLAAVVFARGLATALAGDPLVTFLGDPLVVLVF